jgi:Ion channel
MTGIGPDAPKPSRMKTMLARYREPALTVLVVLDAIYLFVTGPLQQMGLMPAIGNGAIQIMIVTVVFVVCSGSRLAEVIVGLTTVLNIVATMLRQVSPSDLTVGLDIATRILFLLTVIVVVGRAVFSAGDVTHHRIQGAIAIYLNIAVLFAFSYRAIAELVPGSFLVRGVPDELDIGGFVYFSFTTMTTAGYGDITPLHPIARSVANLEGVIGQLFPATLLARIVTLEIETRRSKNDRSS